MLLEWYFFGYQYVKYVMNMLKLSEEGQLVWNIYYLFLPMITNGHTYLGPIFSFFESHYTHITLSPKLYSVNFHSVSAYILYLSWVVTKPFWIMTISCVTPCTTSYPSNSRFPISPKYIEDIYPYIISFLILNDIYSHRQS